LGTASKVLVAMDRRAFLLLAGVGLGASVKTVRAANPFRMVGVLMGLADDAEANARISAVEQGLAKKGWIVGQNLRLECRFANSDEGRIFSLSNELVALHPDVIIGHSTPVVAALHKATQTIPIVFVAVGDPLGSGFVRSMARPDGNITGFTVLPPTITGKYLSILRELEPRLNRVTVLYNPENFPHDAASYVEAFIQSAKEFNVTPVTAVVQNAKDVEKAMTDLGSISGSGLIVFPGNSTTVYRALIISLAARIRIPAIYPYRYFAEDGGLLSYGVDVLDLFRRAPDYVDRILRGAKPEDLPVQAPNKFELVINLKTARALGLVVPRILLAGADALID
jgi:putative tryptophan/tyrosine transport system substrate-binding protein